MARKPKYIPTMAEEIRNLLSEIRYSSSPTAELLRKQTRLLEVQTKALVFIAQSLNTNSQACDKFRKYLEDELTLQTSFPWSWKGGKGWVANN